MCKDPGIMKMFRVDRGAIKFVLAGANIMCPGLTSAGGALDEEVSADAPVAIMAEGKQHALAIGYTKMSAQDMYVSSTIQTFSFHTCLPNWKMCIHKGFPVVVWFVLFVNQVLLQL
jgi:PUA domain protein